MNHVRFNNQAIEGVTTDSLWKYSASAGSLASGNTECGYQKPCIENQLVLFGHVLLCKSKQHL